ncbi:MAG: energy transducer TonB [Bacteroidales bacterium]|nr:energy transducer TonB [Candidatus Latescibacterota bacterium]
MDTYSVSLELAEIQRRTNRLGLLSIAIHILVAVVFIIMRSVAVESEYVSELTEITWFDESVQVADRPVQVAVADIESDMDTDPTEPEVRNIPAVVETGRRISERLSGSMIGTIKKRVINASVLPPVDIVRSIAAPPAAGRSSTRPVRLNRDSRRGEGRPVALAREKNKGPGMLKAVPVDIPSAGKKTMPVRAEMPDAGSAGLSLSGPVSDRALIERVLPEYPEWAKNDGIEVTVQLHFMVLPDGRVKESILVERTSGFKDFDLNAVGAVMDWRFEPLSGGQVNEQWGRIIFNYRLNGGRRKAGISN